MTVDFDMNTVIEVIMWGFGVHYVVMTLAINYAVNRLGKKIAEDYVTKHDLERHVEEHH